MKKIKFTPVDWTYDEKDNWCSSSLKRQSPININNNLANPVTDKGYIVLNYQNKLDAVIDTGYCMQGYLDGVAYINKLDYKLQQFHFHTLSEHTIDSEHFPLEMHLLHQSIEGHQAVIAVLFQIGQKNETFETILDQLNQPNNDSAINLLNLIPKELDYYHYSGSLTTPPLTENVQWYIFTNQMTVSSHQLNRLRQIHNNNFRKTQPLNNRSVFKHTFSNNKSDFRK